MAPKSKKTDIYTNRLPVAVLQVGNNTETFEQIVFGVGSFTNVAILIEKILYYPDAVLSSELAAATDFLYMGITNRDDLASLNPVNMNVYDAKFVQGGAVATLQEHPFVSDYTQTEGGGLLVPANPLYIGVDSAGFANVGTLRAVIMYRFIQLVQGDYLELLQTMIPGTF